MKLKHIALIFLITTPSLCLANVMIPIRHYSLQPQASISVNIDSLDNMDVYSYSCSSNFHRAAMANNQEAVDKMYIQVNPGQATDRYGNHGAESTFTFPEPVGAVNFYAQPDSDGFIDFSIINTTNKYYEVNCSQHRIRPY